MGESMCRSRLSWPQHCLEVKKETVGTDIRAETSLNLIINWLMRVMVVVMMIMMTMMTMSKWSPPDAPCRRMTLILWNICRLRTCQVGRMLCVGLCNPPFVPQVFVWRSRWTSEASWVCDRPEAVSGGGGPQLQGSWPAECHTLRVSTRSCCPECAGCRKPLPSERGVVLPRFPTLKTYFCCRLHISFLSIFLFSFPSFLFLIYINSSFGDSFHLPSFHPFLFFIRFLFICVYSCFISFSTFVIYFCFIIVDIFLFFRSFALLCFPLFIFMFLL